MRLNLNQALDESLALLEAGQANPEECAARYPKHSTDLLPLLETALEVRRVLPPMPSTAAFVAGKRRMLGALAEKRQRQIASPNPFRRYASQFAAMVGKLVVPSRGFAFRLAVVTVSAIILFSAAGLFFTVWRGGTVAQAATLTQVEGTVEIMLAGGDAWQPASLGGQMGAGDRIRTGLLSNATLVFFDESAVELEAETEVSIVEMNSRRGDSSRSIALYQWLGQTYSRVQPALDAVSRFVVETPAATAAARGTEFVVTVAPDGTTSVEVVEGLVEVAGQGSVMEVRAGQQAVIQPGQPPALNQPALTLIPPGQTRTPQPPGLTRTPQPPGLTRTPQPPGLTKTPQQPGPVDTSQPPDQTENPEPPGLTKTPQPPGLTKTPQPPGLTKTPQPPGQEKPPKPTKKPKKE